MVWAFSLRSFTVYAASVIPTITAASFATAITTAFAAFATSSIFATTATTATSATSAATCALAFLLNSFADFENKGYGRCCNYCIYDNLFHNNAIEPINISELQMKFLTE